MPTFFGYSIGVSDIRVTLRDGSERDCLQKIYPVAQSIALGFAGSVYLGFSMVESMKRWLEGNPPNTAWNPLEVVQLWPEIAREIFSSASPLEQAGHCHLMMLSADPQASTGLGPAAYVHVLKSPDFAPLKIDTNKVVGIGSGNFIESYKNSLDAISNSYEENFTLMQFETNCPGGMGTGLGFRVTHLIKSTNPTGISSHLNYCWVYLGKTIVRTNDHLTAGAWTAMETGSGINQPEGTARPFKDDKAIPGATYFEMPKIAQSWHELREMLQGTGAQAEGTVG